MFSQSRRKFTNKCFSTEREHINASHHLAVIQSVSAQWRRSCLYKRFLIILLIKRIAGIEEETTEDESYSEDALQDILEEENITEQAENLCNN